MSRIALVCFALSLTAIPVAAQQSANFILEEHTTNEGGSPSAAAALTSSGYRIRLSSIGGGLSPAALTSGLFLMDTGLVSTLLPPREVTGLVFSSGVDLSWEAQIAAGTYNIYRGSLSDLSGLGFGQCSQSGLPDASAGDAAQPPPGGGFFFLVTAVNRLGEEGGKGFESDSSPRGGNMCP